jgi:hypothetical protein
MGIAVGIASISCCKRNKEKNNWQLLWRANTAAGIDLLPNSSEIAPGISFNKSGLSERSRSHEIQQRSGKRDQSTNIKISCQDHVRIMFPHEIKRVATFLHPWLYKNA